MDTPPPVWNAADSKASLYAFARWLNEEAREKFLLAGSHIQLFFLFAADGTATMYPVLEKVEPDQLAQAIRNKVAEDNPFGVVHVVEAWMYIRKDEKDHTFRQITEGEIAVSELNQGERAEVLLVRLETKDGDSLSMFNQIVRGTPLSLADAFEHSGNMQGRFSKWFQ